MEEFEKEKRKKRFKAKKQHRFEQTGKNKVHREFDEERFDEHKYKLRDLRDIDLEEEY